MHEARTTTGRGTIERLQIAATETFGDRLPEEEPVCFRRNERFMCRNSHCRWRPECCRLVAAWRR